MSILTLAAFAYYYLITLMRYYISVTSFFYKYQSPNSPPIPNIEGGGAVRRRTGRHAVGTFQERIFEKTTSFF
jgi:hypothetical protein